MKIFKPSPLNLVLTAALTTGLFTTNAMAVSDAEYNELKAQLNELANQVEKATASSSHSKTSIGGYGELHYNNLSGTKKGVSGGYDKKEMDFHRFVLFVGHEYNDKIRFFSEFEIEHALAGEGKKGEVEVEQAYVEIDFNKNLSSKAGVILVPVGIINETHEPPTFYGVERNPVEKHIIPATWWVGGLALNGKIDSGINYDLMISEGLNLDDTGSMKDIRKGRQKTSKANMESLAYTGRIKYTGTPGLEVAFTAHYESDLSQGSSLDVDSGLLLETHAIYSASNFTVKALYAQWNISGSDAKKKDKDSQYGYYIEPSYKLNEKWGVFGRYNTWNKTTVSDNKETQIDIGVNYWPHPDVVFKADYVSYKKDTTAKNEFSGFNLGVGYQF